MEYVQFICSIGGKCLYTKDIKNLIQIRKGDLVDSRDEAVPDLWGHTSMQMQKWAGGLDFFIIYDKWTNLKKMSENALHDNEWLGPCPTEEEHFYSNPSSALFVN